jgi:hypothetical protein
MYPQMLGEWRAIADHFAIAYRYSLPAEDDRYHCLYYDIMCGLICVMFLLLLGYYGQSDIIVALFLGMLR